MFVLAWLLVLIPAAVALWCFAAFVLNGGQIVRLLFCAGVPAIAVICLFFVQYWMSRTPPAEPGWDIFYALVCLCSGAATMIVTLPVFFIAEARFARRAL
jgi:hypothetical protein